jgi:Protein of unknown function (DUF1761)
MTFSGLNLIGVLIATVVSFTSGGIWFGPKTFYPIWIRARRVQPMTREESPNMLVLFGSTFVSVFIQTLTLGLIINSLQIHNPNIGIIDGAGIGFALGLGVGAFASLSHRLFSGDGFKVWLIEISNDVLNLTIAGAIIAYFN